MDEVARSLAEFRLALRLEGFTDSEAMELTCAFLTTMLNKPVVEAGAFK